MHCNAPHVPKLPMITSYLYQDVRRGICFVILPPVFLVFATGIWSLKTEKSLKYLRLHCGILPSISLHGASNIACNIFGGALHLPCIFLFTGCDMWCYLY